MILVKIEVARHERMSETGSSLIRLLQNHEMPVLDLLVREAVQNSLDAALDGPDSVDVDFSIRFFETARLARHLEGIEEQLAERFPNKEYRLLEIRDSNTHGLTGPIHESECTADRYGNLIKLIYQIGMPQQKEGSGGSWGLGKTVYFRLGAGIVIYYSRIREDGVYKSRLAACLVEDEKRKDALLREHGSNRGIAWWGQPVSNGSTKPLTDEDTIHELLQDLGSRPFNGDQTGTAVIIPFLRDDLRPENADADAEYAAYEPPWHRSDEEYIAASLQRWYAPRLMNPQYAHGRWLKATVNGESIAVNQFLPAFKIIQQLYNYGLSHRSGVKSDESGFHCEPLRLRGVLETSEVGWISFGKFNRSDLLMAPPDNFPSPWVQIFGRDLPQDSNPPIVAFTRKPGMVVGYEYTGKWVEGIPKTDKDHYVIGIFIANSDNQLVEKHPRFPEQPFLLEEYLRGCEKADHTSWTDWVPNRKILNIVQRIQSNLARKMTSVLVTRTDDQEIRKDAVLGRMLAQALLPPDGFGSGPSPLKKPSSGQGGFGVSGFNPRFNILTSPRYENDLLCMNFELYTGRSDAPVKVLLAVQSESGNIDGDAWEKDDGVGTQFPVVISKVQIKSIADPKGLSNKFETPIELAGLGGPAENGGFRIRGIASSIFHRFCGFEIEGAANKIIQGSIWINPEDRGIRIAFKLDALRGVVNS